MPEPAANTPETQAKNSRGLGSYVVWGFVAAILYVLSVGPAERFRLVDASRHQVFCKPYAPITWL
jgi:hypothetical protein